MATKDAPASNILPDGTELSAPAPDSKPTGAAKEKKRRRLKLKLPAIGALSCSQIWHATVEFLSDPVNVAVTVWMLIATPPMVIIILLKLGLLNSVIPDEQTRENIDEICVQIVNALFALMCLIIHPLLMRHTFLLIRWHPADKIELRQAFCKNGKRKPHDRTHMAMVVFWGQVTCFSTYAFSIVYWLYPLGDRPAWLVSISFTLSMVAPVIGFVYLLVCPLSQDYDIVKEGDDQMLKMYQRTPAFFLAHKEVKEAHWNGTVVPGCCEDPRVAACTFFLPCCMFGYNMERLGFGHRVVHTFAFIIILLGPILVFEFSAESLKNLGVTEKIIYYCGVVLALLGLGYGGAWRIRMRETYGLPGSAICCGSKRLTDVCTWMFCSCCALCQEIRTTDQYQVEETSYYQHAAGTEAGGQAGVTIVEAEEGEDLDADDDSSSTGDVELGETQAPPPVKMVN